MAETQLLIIIEERYLNMFADLQGGQLLTQIRNGDFQDETRKQLQQVLDRISENCGQEDNKVKRKAKRKDRRLKRVAVYNTLLLIAFGVEGQAWNLWYYDGLSAPDLWEANVKLKLVHGSTYMGLLDHIYEDEEIMFKYYHSRKTNWKDDFWLEQSLKIYRMHFVNPIIDMLKPWEDKREYFCRQLLVKAKQEFHKKLYSSCPGRSWRSRARIYWLLARAKHATFQGGRVGKSKSLDPSGPIATLVQQMIEEDIDMFLEKPGLVSVVSHVDVVKYDKQDAKLRLGTLRHCSLLAWASSANYCDLVKCILQHKEEYTKSEECDNLEWEEKWKQSWANALWNAAYKGNSNIVRELLKCQEVSAEQFSGKETHPPLHVAVRRKHISVVEVFCGEPQSFSCHEEDYKKQTSLEVATSLDDKATKKKIQNMLLQRPEVRQAVEESYRQRELTVGSANAIMVGAALIAGVTYGGWLQPPLGYHTYYQFPEPLPAAPSSFESYMYVQGHMSIRMFAIFNSLSFFFAIAAIIAGMETFCFVEDLEETYIAKTVKKLKFKLRRTTFLFIASVVFVLIAFGSAAIAILPPIELYRKDMTITICVGGTVCLAFIGRMLLFSTVSKCRFYKQARSQFGRMCTTTNEEFWKPLGRTYVPSPCKAVWKGIKYWLDQGN